MSSVSSLSSVTVTTPHIFQLYSRPLISLQPPVRPPRPKTSLPNLRPVTILSPITVPPPVYHLPMPDCSAALRKTVSFSEDVFAALPSYLGLDNEINSGAESPSAKASRLECGGKGGKTSNRTGRTRRPQLRVKINDIGCHQGHQGHGLEKNNGSGPSMSPHSPYASSSILGTSMTCGYYQERKQPECSSWIPAASSANQDSPEQGHPEDNGEDFKEGTFTPWQAWLCRHRRILWMVGTIVFVLAAASSVTGAVLWRLTTCRCLTSLHALQFRLIVAPQGFTEELWKNTC